MLALLLLIATVLACRIGTPTPDIEPTPTRVDIKAVEIEAEVVADSATLRAAPGVGSEAIGLMEQGTRVVIVGETPAQDWYMITIPDVLGDIDVGWVAAEFVAPVTPIASPVPTRTPAAMATSAPTATSTPLPPDTPPFSATSTRSPTATPRPSPTGTATRRPPTPPPPPAPTLTSTSAPATWTPVPPPSPTDTPTAMPGVSFRADHSMLNAGQCTTLRWDVENAREVYLDGQGVVGHGSQQVCPASTTTYTLQVVLLDGATTDYSLTISVSEPVAPNPPSRTPTPAPFTPTPTATPTTTPTPSS